MRTTRTAVIVLIVAAGAAMMLALSGIGYRQQLWTLRKSLT